jgi:hypothetical protein
MENYPSMHELPATAYRVDGKRVDLSIKRDVEKGNWDDGKGSKPEIKALKVRIEEIRRRLFDYFDELFKDKRLITA